VKRVNVRFLLLFLVGLAALAGATVALNRFQVMRNAGTLAKQARQRLEEGKQAEAMSLFARYLGMRPEDAEVHAEYAELVLERALAADATQGDLARAYNTLEEAVRRNPDKDPLRRKLAEFQLRIGRAVDAREHLDVLQSRLESGTIQKGTDDDPEAPAIDADTLQLLMAQSFAGAGDFDMAAKLAGDLIGFDMTQRVFDPAKKAADSTDAYILLASILQQRFSDPAAADGVLQELVTRRGTDAQAWLAMSRWHRQTAEFDAAAQDIEKAAAIAPNDINVVFGRFELALARQDLAAAAEVAATARTLFPADERVYRGLASVAMQRNDLDGAEQALRDGTAALPNKASLLLMLADVLLQRNKLDETDQIIARIKELYGAMSPAVGLLESRLLMARQRWPQARQKLEQIRPLAAGLNDLTRQVDLCLGQCYEQLQEFDEQLDINRRILVDDPTSLAARAGAAAALAAAGKNEEALREFEAVAKSLPPDRLPAIPQIWYPLIQLRVAEQLKRTAIDRDWSGIDSLVTTLEESPAISPTQVALLRADILSRKGETGAAIELLDKAARSGPVEAQVWSALATLTLRERGSEAARQVIERVPAEQAERSGILLVEAQIAAAAPGDEAEQALTAIAARAEALGGDEAARTLASLSSIQLSRGARPEARELLRKAAAIQPDDLKSRTALLEMAMAEGDVEQARGAAADIRAVAGPANARSLVGEAGVKILEVRTAQQKQDTQNGRIDLTDDDRRLLDEARNLLIEAENERPGWHLIQRYFAEVEGLKGDLNASISRLQQALRLDPANPEVVRQLVGLLYATNRTDEARAALDSLGEGGSAGFERVSAELELRAGKLEEAVALAERSVKADSSNPGELLWLGQLLDRSGKGERAGEVFARAVELAPDRSDAWLSLFSHQLGNGKRRAAENTLDRAATVLGEPQRQLTLAQGYEMLGRLDDAEREYLAASKSAASDVAVQRANAEFLVRHGRLQEARQAIEGVLAAPDDAAGAVPAKAWARRKLAELIAGRGTYRNLEEALALIGQNALADGTLASEDAQLEISLLANRPEPTSWTRAIDVIERLAEQQPLSTGQRMTLAGLLEKVGRWNEAREELMSIVSAPNAPPAVVGMLVEKLIDHDELENARTWLKRLATTAPTAPVTLALEARLAMASNDRTAAAEAARKLMPKDNVAADQAAQLAAIARLMEDLGFPKAADQVLTTLADVSPDGVVPRAEFLGRHDRASEALDLLQDRWDDVPLERLLTAAVAVARSKDTATSEAQRLDGWFAKGRRIDPGSITIPLLEAELRGLQGRPQDVETTYRKLLERPDLTPMQTAIVSNNLAFHLATPSTAAEARTLIDAAIGTLGPHPDLLDTRALIHLAAGEDKKAMADLEQAVLQPSDVKFLHLAYAQFRVGDTAAARTSLAAGRKKGLDADRLSASDRSRLAELETALGESPEQAVSEPAPAPAT
jgi:tetratricopeptide (TPR) repeat protein